MIVKWWGQVRKTQNNIFKHISSSKCEVWRCKDDFPMEGEIYPGFADGAAFQWAEERRHPKQSSYYV